MASAATQLQAMSSLSENWDGYGAAAPQAHVIELAQGLVDLLEATHDNSASKSLTIHVSPTRTGGVLIEWEDASFEHEVDIGSDGSIGFLHLNRTTGNIETRKYVASYPAVVHPGFLRELKLLLAA